MNHFLDVRVWDTSSEATGFSLPRIWAAIEAVPAPPAIPIPNIASIVVTPAPLPPGLNKVGTKTLLRIMIVGVTLWLLTIIPDAWFFVLGGAWWAWAAVSDLGGGKHEAEKARRQAARDLARQEYDQVVQRITQEIGPEVFSKKKTELARLRDEYQHLPEREKKDIANLHATARARQMQRFLERHFIDGASIYGVGPAKIAALRSFGIETAADVKWNKVIGVKGFGEVLTRAVVDWRKACERRFVFNPNLAVTESDKNAVRATIASRKRSLEKILTAGAGDLRKLHQEMINREGVLRPLIDHASQKLAQAQADVNEIR